MNTTRFRTLLLRLVQEVESRAGEIADALDSEDHRLVRIPAGDDQLRLCIALLGAADQQLQTLRSALDPTPSPMPQDALGLPATLGGLRDLLCLVFGSTLEGVTIPGSASPTEPLPSSAKWIACYAAPGANESHFVHIDAIIPSPHGASTIRQLLLAKTELGLDQALAVAATCTSIIYGVPSSPAFVE